MGPQPALSPPQLLTVSQRYNLIVQQIDWVNGPRRDLPASPPLELELSKLCFLCDGNLNHGGFLIPSFLDRKC